MYKRTLYKQHRYSRNRWNVVLLLWLALGVAVLWPGTVWANIGPGSWGGQVTAEPQGLADVTILHETLTLDLRPLAANGLAEVEAIYQVDNRGPAHQLDLLFPTGATGVTDFQLWHNETLVESRVIEQATLPETWSPPEQTPGLHGKNAMQYSLFTTATTLGFTLQVMPGQQTIRAHYRAEATGHIGYNQPTIYWQFAYILAPARYWAGFGGLDVTIYLPAHWLAATTPALPRTGDLLQAHFTSLPADALALTLQAPAGWLYWLLFYLSRGCWVVALIGGGWRCWWVARTNASRDDVILEGFIMALLWGVVVLVTGLIALWLPGWALPAGQSRTGYEREMLSVFLLFLSGLLILVGILLVALTVWVTRRLMGRRRV